MAKGNKTGKNTYLRGNTTQVMAPVIEVKTEEADEIAVGDMVYLSRQTICNQFKARPMSHAAAASIDLRCGADFLGVAMDRSKDGDTDEILVYTDGIFEFDLASSSTLYLGEPAQLQAATEGTVGASSVDCYTIAPSATPTHRRVIGTIVKAGTSQTIAEVKINSKILHGSLDSAWW